MLSADHEHIVRRDRALPGLAVLLDAEAFAERLQNSLSVMKINAAHPRYIRYKPGTNCLVSYQLESDGATIDVYAKTYGNDTEIKLAKAYHRKTRVNSDGYSYIILDGYGIMISFFPNDAKIRRLNVINNAHFRQELLENIFPGIAGSYRAELESMAYNPERRYVAKLIAHDDTKAVIKFYQSNEYTSAANKAGSFQSRNLLRIPRFLGSMEKYGVLAYEWLQGNVLSEIIMHKESEVPAVIETGSALAELHNQNSCCEAYKTPLSEAASINALAERIGFLCPHLKVRALQLASRLCAWLLSERPQQMLIHGDFYAEQVLWSREGIGIIDLDETMRGDPRSDLGNFIAHLIRWGVDDETIATIQGALTWGYRKTAPQSTADRIEPYIAVRLFHLIHHPFRECEPNWAKKTEELLNSVEQLIAVPAHVSASGLKPIRASSDVPVVDPFGVENDRKMPYLWYALDPVRVQQYISHDLSHVFSEKETVRVTRIGVARYKPERRCIIEYDILFKNRDGQEHAMTLIGKTCSCGLDAATYLLSQSFWHIWQQSVANNIFNIPRPLGVIPKLEMWFQQKVSGTAATDLLGTPYGLSLARRIADAIHMVHKTNIPSERRHMIEDELNILHEKVPLVIKSNPQWQRRVARILNACRRLGTRVSDIKPVGIHRDFYPDHVLVQGERLWLLDFDLYCMGDPALDVGNFLGHLKEQSLRLHCDVNALKRCEKVLEDRFVELADERLRTNIAVYTTLTLVRHIYISTLFTDRRPFTEEIIKLCEQRLGIAGENYNKGISLSHPLVIGQI